MPNMPKVKILAFAGSTRRDSLNKKLVKAAARLMPGAQVEVTVIDLADYPLPLYDGDLHAAQGVPENARRLRRLVAGHQGLLVASPEFNGSYSAVLKNALDWASIRDGGPNPFAGKPAALLAASSGRLGGIRGLGPLRMLLSDLGMVVLPEVCALGAAASAFNEAGGFKDEKVEEAVRALGVKLAVTARKLAP
jgi:NAD(P)H-dependent FMN reductase